MLPSELEPKVLNLPASDVKTIVIITKNSLRHQRFALRMLETFGDRIIKWYVIEKRTNVSTSSTSLPKKVFQKLKKIDWSLEVLKLIFQKVFAFWRERKANKTFAKWRYTAETYLFEEEVKRLRKKITRKPTFIEDPNTPTFYKEMEELKPYFFISLGGPLYSKKILKQIQGCAINQHAGHSPQYKGDSTVQWALYHRELNKVSSTVHITAMGADTGGILRRIGPCVLEGENPVIYFNRVVALGTELIIEVVEDILVGKTVYYHPQPKFMGKTKLSFHMERKVRLHLWLDYKERVIDYLLKKQREF